MNETEVVVFIHSTGTGPFLWQSVPDAAVGARATLFPANIGYGPNGLVERGRTVTVREEVAHVLAAIPDDERRVHLVAHSYGGLVALHAMPLLADRLASAFLFEPVVFGGLARASDADPAAVAQAREFAAHPWFLTDAERGGRDEWLEMFIDYWNRPGSWAKLPAPMRELSLAVGWKMFQEVRACFLDETPFSSFRLTVPTTMALGDRTTVASRAMSQGLARSHSNVALVEIGGVGHMAPLTHPARVHEALAQHFAHFEEARA